MAPLLSTLIIVSLISLSTLTTFVQLRSRRLNQEINEVYLPARTMVQIIQVATANQASAISTFLRTGEGGSRAGYQTAGIERDSALAQLSVFARAMTGDFDSHLARFRLLADSLDATPFAMGTPDAQSRMSIREVASEAALAQQAVAGAASLAAGVDAAVLQHRNRIDAAERMDWRFTLILSVFAISAGMLNRWLGDRVRHFAAESERRRVLAESVLEGKARLMRGLSHDLRTPLGIVSGYAHLLEMEVKGSLNEGQREIVERIQSAAGSSLGILDDVLDLSRAESGQLRMHVSPLDILPVLRASCDDHELQMADAGLSFTSRLPAEAPTVETDALRVRQILGNLLSNAIKYTPPGGSVVLSAAVQQESVGGEGWLVLEVADDGPGIPEPQQERIFEEFYRLEGSDRRAKGLGVGLAISRRVAHLLGGDLTVRSQEGHGSAFELRLPLRAAHEA